MKIWSILFSISTNRKHIFFKLGILKCLSSENRKISQIVETISEIGIKTSLKHDNILNRWCLKSNISLADGYLRCGDRVEKTKHELVYITCSSLFLYDADDLQLY